MSINQKNTGAIQNRMAHHPSPHQDHRDGTWAEVSTFNRIRFTRQGWKQFGKINRGLGARYIRAIILKRELAAYITAHERAGRLDADCQEVRYDGGIYLTLRKMQGTWYITDVISTQEPVFFSPVYVWRKIRLGVADVAARVLHGWRALSENRSPSAAGRLGA